MRLRSNPPWADRFLESLFGQLSYGLDPGLMPQTGFELGCGSFGCVYPTAGREFVCKLTWDGTEAILAHYLKHVHKGKPLEGLPTYAEVARVNTGNGPVWLLWRDALTDVGAYAPCSIQSSASGKPRRARSFRVCDSDPRRSAIAQFTIPAQAAGHYYLHLLHHDFDWRVEPAIEHFMGLCVRNEETMAGRKPVVRTFREPNDVMHVETDKQFVMAWEDAMAWAKHYATAVEGPYASDIPELGAVFDTVYRMMRQGLLMWDVRNENIGKTDWNVTEARNKRKGTWRPVGDEDMARWGKGLDPLPPPEGYEPYEPRWVISDGGMALPLTKFWLHSMTQVGAEVLEPSNPLDPCQLSKAMAALQAPTFYRNGRR